VPEDADVSALERRQTDDGVDRRGLAGAVGSEKSEELAGRDRK
jgi:hypothetical protein